MFDKDNLTALEAQRQATFICYAPMIFQSVKTMLNLGIMDVLKKAGEEGIVIEEIVEKTGVWKYGVRVLLQSALGAGVVYQKDDRYILTKTGFFLISKQLASQIHINFVNDVCYNGMFFLEDSIKDKKPKGLKVLGNWDTIYDGLSELSPEVKKSWLDLDHYFSDISYDKAFNILSEEKFNTILDLGGNTGKFCRYVIKKMPEVEFTIADLPGQIKMAKKEMEVSGLNTSKVKYQAINILNEGSEIEGKFDIIWMSQFLDCFNEDDISIILKKCKKALKEDGSIFVQDAFWDRQRFETGAFSLQQFSLYFTAMANGRSQMYDFATFKEAVENSGLEIIAISDHLGRSNSLLKIK
ncbi:class I SAM-dependent methyltransferase [Flavobacterium chilense]|uniref:O-methyltransferase n=1 Tax=Flavobacterium chilense TaxID=946677 RepID=A0A1M7MWM8_9FLAO|nr:class I SAM-dependent methyltransferase [Flavobacterium chilense]SHM95474.1 O-methyltransferase [Flavobacterium chilense]